MATAAIPFIGAGISAIGSLVGAGKQEDAVKSAAATQDAAETKAGATMTAATTAANDFTKTNLSNVQSSEAPYQATGVQALGELNAGTAPGGQFAETSLPADQVLANDPGYDFRLDQGTQALQRAEAAGGGVASGGAIKAGSQYGQDYASGEYAAANARLLAGQQQRFGQETTLADIGQTGQSNGSQCGHVGRRDALGNNAHRHGGGE
jgi:hypothetical protein